MPIHTLVDVAAIALLADFLGMGLALLAGRQHEGRCQVPANAWGRHSNLSRRARKRRMVSVQ
jgi:hypothetical protein